MVTYLVQKHFGYVLYSGWRPKFDGSILTCAPCLVNNYSFSNSELFNTKKFSQVLGLCCSVSKHEGDLTFLCLFAIGLEFYNKIILFLTIASKNS